MNEESKFDFTAVAVCSFNMTWCFDDDRDALVHEEHRLVAQHHATTEIFRFLPDNVEVETFFGRVPQVTVEQAAKIIRDYLVDVWKQELYEMKKTGDQVWIDETQAELERVERCNDYHDLVEFYIEMEGFDRHQSDAVQTTLDLFVQEI